MSEIDELVMIKNALKYGSGLLFVSQVMQTNDKNKPRIQKAQEFWVHQFWKRG